MVKFSRKNTEVYKKRFSHLPPPIASTLIGYTLSMLNTDYHEELSEVLKIQIPSKKLLVGAAGFEPATYCSQSSRAARLRYAPNMV
jgi:hypothetical protein